MLLTGSFRPCLWLAPLGFVLSTTGSAQEVRFQLSAGTGLVDAGWHGPPQIDGWPVATVTGELGILYAFSPTRRVRLVLSSTVGLMSVQQAAMDFQWTILTWSRGALGVFAGPSLNNVAGTYAWHDGFRPPQGEGDYRDVAQNGRPGLKAGVSFQWTRNLALELEGHLINMSTTGDQAVKSSTTEYVALVVSFSFSGGS